MHRQFLQAGIAVAGIDVGEAYGSPAGTSGLTRLHKELTEKHGFALKPCLLGRSRGGLWVSRWAIENPQSVAGIAGIYPVFDLRTYPGVERTAGAYGLSPQQLEARIEELNPITQIGQLAQARIPVFLIHGDEDTVVPLQQNSAEWFRQYQAHGAQDLAQLVIAKGQGHNYWEGFFRCQALVDFSIQAAQRSQGISCPVVRQTASSRATQRLLVRAAAPQPAGILASGNRLGCSARVERNRRSRTGTADPADKTDVHGSVRANPSPPSNPWFLLLLKSNLAAISSLARSLPSGWASDLGASYSRETPGLDAREQVRCTISSQVVFDRLSAGPAVCWPAKHFRPVFSALPCGWLTAGCHVFNAHKNEWALVHIVWPPSGSNWPWVPVDDQPVPVRRARIDDRICGGCRPDGSASSGRYSITRWYRGRTVPVLLWWDAAQRLGDRSPDCVAPRGSRSTCPDLAVRQRLRPEHALRRDSLVVLRKANPRR